jgi:hypothetical protein
MIYKKQVEIAVVASYIMFIGITGVGSWRDGLLLILANFSYRLMFLDRIIYT